MKTDEFGKYVLLALVLATLPSLMIRINCEEEVYVIGHAQLNDEIELNGAQALFFRNAFGRQEVLVYGLNSSYEIEAIHIKGLNKRFLKELLPELSPGSTNVGLDEMKELRQRGYLGFAKITVMGKDLSFLMNRRPTGIIYYEDSGRSFIDSWQVSKY